MKIINLTSQDFSFVDEEKKTVILTFTKRSDFLEIQTRAREKEVGFIWDIIRIKQRLVDYEIINLPEQEEGTLFIVPEHIAQKCPERDDFYCPDGPVVDKEGKHLGFSGLAQF